MAQRIKKIVAVASGKGGVGKSTVTTQLATSLSRRGLQVGVLDVDIYGPSIPTMFGLESFDMKNTTGQPVDCNGIKVFSAAMIMGANKANILRGPMIANIAKQMLEKVNWGDLDLLLVDFPPGTGDIQLSLCQSSLLQAAVLVTTPQKVATDDVEKAFHMFDTLQIPVVGMVENMSYFICDGCDKQHKIFPHDGAKKLGEKFGLPLLGTIPIDPALAARCDSGQSSQSPSPELESMADEFLKSVTRLDELKRTALGSFSLKWRTS